MSAKLQKERVWMITGTSTGFGFEFVRAALERGDTVVATSRHPAKVAAAFPDRADQLLVCAMDVKNSDQIAGAVHEAVVRFGRIDVLVNNAGYGLIGAVEEASDDEIARVYEVNVLGLLRVTRAVLPHFRHQRSGHIINLSSIGGLVGVPGFGLYNATKFAVEGISEALARELEPFGVGVTLVEPGPYRTDFLAGSLALAQRIIPGYESTAGQARSTAVTRNGKQAGDPVRAVKVIIDAVTSEHPPLHLLLGRLAYDYATTKLENLRKDMETWRQAALATDFPPENAA